MPDDELNSAADDRPIRITRPWDGTTEEGEVPRPGFRTWLGYVIQRDTDSDQFVWVTLSGTRQTPTCRGAAASVEVARVMIQDSVERR